MKTASVIAFGLFTSLAIAAPPFPEQAVITRFFHHPDYSSASRVYLGKGNNHRYRTLDSGDWSVAARPSADPAGPCSATLIEHGNSFALNRMVDRSYVKLAVANEFRDFFKELNPDQITFFERARWQFFPTAQKPLGPEWYLDGRASDDKTGDWYRLRLATMWLVSGQSISGREKSLLPWERDSAFAPLVLDRKKYKMVFEFGRTSQIEPGLAEELVRLAALEAYAHAIAQGVQPADVLVFAHAYRKAWVRDYRKNGFTDFGTEKGNEENTVMVQPLDKLLIRFPPDHLESVSKVQALAKGKLNPVEAFRLLAELKDLRRMDLDWHRPDFNGPRPSPVVIRDRSRGVLIGGKSLLAKKGLNPDDLEKYLALLDHFRTLQANGPSPAFNSFIGGDIYPRLSPYEGDVSVAILDPRNITTFLWLLFSIDDFYTAHMANSAFEAEKHQAAFHAQDVRYSVTTPTESLYYFASQEKLLMPRDGIFEAPYQEIRHGRGAEAYPSAMSWGGAVESITVTRGMLNALRAKHPAIAEKAKTLALLRLGEWQTELRLRNLMND